jgi:hypothetical protein
MVTSGRTKNHATLMSRRADFNLSKSGRPVAAAYKPGKLNRRAHMVAASVPVTTNGTADITSDRQFLAVTRSYCVDVPHTSLERIQRAFHNPEEVAVNDGRELLRAKPNSYSTNEWRCSLVMPTNRIDYLQGYLSLESYRNNFRRLRDIPGSILLE